MAIRIRRREFIFTLGGAAAAWPLATRAQQSSTMRRIGFLGPLSERTQLQWTTAFLKGLRDHGWIEGTTISIDYRWAEGRSDRFAELAAELVRREVNIIVTAGTEPAIAVKHHSEHPNRLRGCGRPGGNRLGRKPRKAGR